MDVLHLRTHVLTGHEVGGVGGALTRTRGLSAHHDAEALGGGIRGTGLGASAVDPAAGGRPAAGSKPRSN